MSCSLLWGSFNFALQSKMCVVLWCSQKRPPIEAKETYCSDADNQSTVSVYTHATALLLHVSLCTWICSLATQPTGEDGIRCFGCRNMCVCVCVCHRASASLSLNDVSFRDPCHLVEVVHEIHEQRQQQEGQNHHRPLNTRSIPKSRKKPKRSRIKLGTKDLPSSKRDVLYYKNKASNTTVNTSKLFF